MKRRVIPINPDRSQWGALQIAAGYLLLGALWILFSDKIAAHIAVNADALSRISIYKGWGYVFVTAVLLYWLIKRYAQNIKKANERYKLIAENASDVIWLLDPVNGKFKYISPSVLKLRGYTAEEVMSQTLNEAFVPDDVERLTALTMERIAQFQAKGSGTLSFIDEVSQPHKDGSIVSTEATTTYFFNDQNEIEIMGVTRDISRRKQAEMKQRASEHKYQQLLDQASDGIFIANADGRYTLVNEEACRLVGYTKDELLSMNLRDLVAPENMEITPLKLDELRAGRALTTERKLLHKDGSRIVCEISSKMLPDGSLQSIVRDITERKVTEDALVRSEKRHRSLFENMMDAYTRCQMLYDEEGNPYDFMYLDVNNAFKRITRLKDVIGKRVSEVITGVHKSNPELLTNYERVASTGQSVRFETYVPTLGAGTWLSISAYSFEKGFFVAVFENITERKIAEESLQRSYDQLLSFIVQAPLSIAMFDRKMNYLAVSQRWTHDLGRGYKDLVGHNHYDVNPDLPDSWIAAQQKGLAGESLKNDDDLWVQNDGTKYWLSWAITPWKDEHGKIGGIIISAEDISERKRAEATAFKSELRYHRVLDAMMEGCQIIDFEWRYVYVNDVVAGQGKRKPEELLNHTMMEIYPGIEQTEMFTSLRRCMENREPHRMENQFIFPDGNIGWFELSIQPAEEGIFVLSTDITERKQAEKQVRYQASLLTNISEAIIATDEKWIVTSWNRAAEEMYGWSAEEAIGKVAQDLVRSDFTNTQRADAIKSLAETGHFKLEILQYHRNGQSLWVEGNTIALRDQDGKPTGFVSVNRNITERKQVETVLHESEERLRLSLQAANQGLYDLNVQTGKTTVNREYAEMLGYNFETFVETNAAWIERLHPDDQHITAKAYSEYINGRLPEYRVEFRQRTKDGKWKWILSLGKIVEYDAQGKPLRMVGTHTDITERKRAEEALRQSQENFARAFNSNPAALAITGVDDGKFLILNEAYTDIMGYEPSEVLGNTVAALNIYVNPEERSHLIHQLREQGRVRNHELLVRSKSGNTKTLMVSMEPILYDDVQCILSTFLDITERKQMEEEIHKLNTELEQRVVERTAELSEANALLQAMMDNIPDQIYFKDRKSCFIRNSRAQVELMGLNDPEEVVGKSDFDFFPHAQRAFDEEQEVMRSGQPLLDIEEYVVWPSGRVMWVSTSKVPLMDQEGRTIGIFGISRDITERKYAEEKLQKAKTGLETANKELESFSYSVSHDLRAPLRAIDGYTNILLEDYEPLLDEEGKRICGIISREAKQMGKLIDDLLSFSRMGRREVRLQKIDMKALVDSIFDELFKGEDRSRIEVHVADLPSATGDAALMRQVWVNLLSNAIKFTSKKTRAVIQVDYHQDEEGVVYSVHDNGAGFDMEYVDKLFGVFQRLHSESEFEGTGVGLAIVQRVVHRHGGRVWAEGQVNEGATFHFLLPQRDE